MFDQHDDGSHEITLHGITCYGKKPYPNTSGILKWSPDSGIRFSLNFDGLNSLSSDYYSAVAIKSNSVGKLAEFDDSTPQWVAKTDDGTPVKLFAVNETPTSTTTTGTSGRKISCQVNGTANFAVIDIPYKRLLAFENNTEEDFRMFFIGHAGRKYHTEEEVTFEGVDGNHLTTYRCSIKLSEKAGVALVSAHGLVKCRPAGWLAFREPPLKSDTEIGAFAYQNFVSFLNGRKVKFYWADRKLDSVSVRRTYYGWVTSAPKDLEGFAHQPIPILNSDETFSHGDETLAKLPKFFDRFIQHSSLIDFGKALHPMWTGYESVHQDRLALVSISLERITSAWKKCKAQLAPTNPCSTNKSIWKNRGLLKKLRQTLLESLNNAISVEQQKKKWTNGFVKQLIAVLNSFLDSEACMSLSEKECNELREVITVRINDLTRPPNSASLRTPFEDQGILLTDIEEKAIRERNSALHGSEEENALDMDNLNRSAEYFDCLSMLVTKFVLKICDYDGPFIDYSSRPSNGNFEIKRL